MKAEEDKFNKYCLQQWAAYVERAGTLGYKEYLRKNKKLLEEKYNARPQD